MKRRLITTIIGGLLALGAHAQQDAEFSQYFFNPLYVNPGYAGSRDALSGTLVYRDQWHDLPGSPVTESFSLHSPIPHTGVGLGLSLYNDKLGPLVTQGVQLTYAYNIRLSLKTKLAIGVSGSLNNLRVHWSDITIDDNSDPSFLDNGSSLVPDANVGLYLYRSRFYAGVSAVHILQSDFNLQTSTGDAAKYFRQYYLFSGVVLKVSQAVNFKPSILVKGTSAAPVNFEVDGAFIFYNKLFLGAGFRTSKRIGIPGTDNMLIGILEYEILDHLRLGYSYDAFLNRTGQYNSGTHEIMLGWDIGLTKTKMTSPRFF